MSLKSKIQAIITAANAKTGEADVTLTDAVQTLVDGYGGITPSGSVTLIEEGNYDVTDKATAVVDMSATRANLAEAVTAKGVDTLPTSSFDTIATNIGLITGGGGGLPSGISKFNHGTFTVSEEGVKAIDILHNLGVVPDFVFCIATRTQRGTGTFLGGYTTPGDGSAINGSAYNNNRSVSWGSTQAIRNITATAFRVARGSSSAPDYAGENQFMPGIVYYWVAIKLA